MSDVVNNFNFEFLSNFDDLDDLSLSQAVDKYELAEISSGEFDDIDFGQFGMSTEDLISGSLENKRFGSVKQVDTADIRQLVANQESKNTRRNTNWAKRTWDEWAAWRGNIPDLTKMNVSDLNHFLSCFVLECRRKDGSEYPAATLYQISAGLLRYMRDNGVTDLNFLDNNDKRFYNFRKTLDARMKEISSKGIGLKKKQADPISPDDENLLWDKNLLGSGSSKSMLNTVFYYNCKLFGLRGMDEHRSLTSDQFTLGQDKEGTYIDFQGKTSKNFSGGLHQRKIEAKHVRHYSSSSDMRSLYLIYKNYLDLIGSSGPGSFYRRPISGPTPRFSSQVVGVNKLSTIVKNMCSEAGLSGNFSNHSGKRTCATSLYNNGIDEQLIMERTGHRSDSVRKYKRTSTTQQSKVSKLLDPPPKKICSSGTENTDPDETPNTHLDVKSSCERYFGECLIPIWM